MIIAPSLFLLFTLTASQLYHGWIKNMDNVGEISSLLNGTLGPMDYYQYLPSGMKLTLFQHIQGLEKELKLTINGLTEEYQNDSSVELKDLDVLAEFVSIKNINAFRSEKSKERLKTKGNISFTPQKSLYLETLDGGFNMVFSYEAKLRQDEQLINNLQTKPKNQKNDEEIQTNSVTKPVKQQAKGNKYNSKFGSTLTQSQQLTAFYLYLSLARVLFYLYASHINMSYWNDGSITFSACMELLIGFTEILYLFQYKPAIKNDQFSWQQVILSVLVFANLVVFVIFYGALIDSFCKQIKTSKMIARILIGTSIFITPYNIFLSFVFIAIIYDSYQLLRKDYINDQTRPLYHLQAFMALGSLFLLVWGFGTPKRWSIGQNVLLWGCVGIWAYMAAVYEISFRGGVGPNIRKLRQYFANKMRRVPKDTNSKQMSEKEDFFFSAQASEINGDTIDQ